MITALMISFAVFCLLVCFGIWVETLQQKRDALCALGKGDAESRKLWQKALIQAKADIEKESVR